MTATRPFESATRRRGQVEPLGRRRALLRAGDLIVAPVGASHGFAPLGGKRLGWIEVRFVFHKRWGSSNRPRLPRWVEVMNPE